MANGKIRFGKQSGGQLAFVIPDGVANTEVVLPESGTVASVSAAVTDNAIARYDGTTGKLQNSGVVIDDNNNVGVGVTPIHGYCLELAGSIYQYGNQFNANHGSQYTEIINRGPSGFQFYVDSSSKIAMTVEKNGNLLVGATTDNGVDKLQVDGSISSRAIQQYISGDLNNFKYITQTIGTYPNMSNTPINDPGYLEIIVYAANVYVMQRFTTVGVVQTAGRVFVRCLTNGTWTGWVEK